MNENLVERSGRTRAGGASGKATVEISPQPQQVNWAVREYFNDGRKAVKRSQWLRRPEVPSSTEIMDVDTDRTNSSSSSSDVVEIVPNRPVGPWDSKEMYLSAHYELLREDATRPLREAVSQLRIVPAAHEQAFNGTIGIYDKVHICALTPSPRGIAIRVTFSLRRCGKRILWDQSKRLISGTLVALTPASDMFKTHAIVATVAARPLDGVMTNPPEVDLFFASAEELEIDPAQEWVMTEARNGFFEAAKHTLVALQRMMIEPFPLAEHLVQAKVHVAPPQYVLDDPRRDLTSILRNNKQETYENIDMLRRWPSQPSSDLDASQLAAVRRMLAKRFANVQGPPGTGKTFVSVQTVKVMLANRKASDPPILIASQTNHAVDQILRHIAAFEPDFVRLGSRTKDRDLVKSRTLYEVRRQTHVTPLAGCLKPGAWRKMKLLQQDIARLLLPLGPSDKRPLDPSVLKAYNLLNQAQIESLEAGASEWVQDQLSDLGDARNPFTVWLGSALVTVPAKQQPEHFEFDFEEADLEFEQLKELEAENAGKDDEDFESLPGQLLSVADNFTCRAVPGITSIKIKEALNEQDLWRIQQTLRGAVYRHLQAELKKAMLRELRKLAQTFDNLAKERQIGQWELDETILKRQKVIGMTTTGFSKYRGLLASLKPKVILIEEAGETLEALVTVTCLPTLQQMILVGDHKQLRPHTQVKAHEDAPYYLNVSLFERMINNKVEFDTLTKQRRMIPEIRRLLYPIYKGIIKDHSSVLDPEKRPNVRGMGGVNTFFFSHNWPEDRDDQMSAFNKTEADMIVGFVEYLVYNGYDTGEITILTFYNGQRKRLLKSFRTTASLAGRHFTVVTVDSYQGEENKIVILSLVRSNDRGQIGFLSIDNRVCVALSRAQCGFYLFGNGELLYNNHKTWSALIEIMAGEHPKTKKDLPTVEPIRRIDEALPVRCSLHGKGFKVAEPDDWQEINGGCDAECTGHLPCGHTCTLKCHPFSHDRVICYQNCDNALPCGHGKCSVECWQPCLCKICAKNEVANKTNESTSDLLHRRKMPSQDSHSSSVFSQSASVQERLRHAAAITAPSSLLAHSGPENEAKVNEANNHIGDLLGLCDDSEVSGGIKSMALSSKARFPPAASAVDDLSVTSTETMQGLNVEAGDGDKAEVNGLLKRWSQEKSLLDDD